MDAETVKSDNNTVMMAQTPPVMPAEAPGQQSISECEHRPLLKVDRTGGMAGARHFLIPVDDTEVTPLDPTCRTSQNNFAPKNLKVQITVNFLKSCLAAVLIP